MSVGLPHLLSSTSDNKYSVNSRETFANRPAPALPTFSPPKKKCPNGGILHHKPLRLSRLAQRLIPRMHPLSDGILAEVTQRPPPARATHSFSACIVLEQHQERLG
jgi:hypothetical protein